MESGVWIQITQLESCIWIHTPLKIYTSKLCNFLTVYNVLELRGHECIVTHDTPQGEGEKSHEMQLSEISHIFLSRGFMSDNALLPT